MTTMLNVHEAKMNFSGLLGEVESKSAVFTIMRYGRPIARIVPIKQKREIKPLPGYGGKIKIKDNLFSDESALWENA